MTTIRLKVLPRFPSSIIGGTGIVVTRESGEVTISVDLSTLVIDFSSLTFSGVLSADNGGPPGEPAIITTGSASIAAQTAAVAVRRVAPTTTALALPAVGAQNKIPLRIFDWSTSVTDHAITLTPDGTEKIMLAATWTIYSNAAQLGGLLLYPSTTLGGWFIAP